MGITINVYCDGVLPNHKSCTTRAGFDGQEYTVQDITVKLVTEEWMGAMDGDREMWYCPRCTERLG